MALQAGANTACTLASAPHLRRLDEFGLLCREQPLAADDLLGHAELTRQLATPVCLDESITSPQAAATALRLGTCSLINIKPAGRRLPVPGRPPGAGLCDRLRLGGLTGRGPYRALGRGWHGARVGALQPLLPLACAASTCGHRACG